MRNQHTTAERMRGAPTRAEIIRLRKEAGLSQVAAARMVGFCRRVWQYWESGERKMEPAVWMVFKARVNLLRKKNE